MIIGITGRSGSGKSYLSEKIAEELDLIHIDIDKISHEVLSFVDTQAFLVEEFGNEIFIDGKLNRKLLGKIVFGSKEGLLKLNRFCQIQIEKKIDEILTNANKPVILDYALLCGLKQFKQCDIKILLKADFDIRFSRVKTRENISKEYFISRDRSLAEFNDKMFDFVYTNMSVEDTENLIKTLKTQLKRS